MLVGFSVVSILAGNGMNMPGNIWTFLRNILLDPIYNGAWWYLYVYVFIVLISPLLLKTVKTQNTFYVLLLGFAIYCGSYYIRFKLPYTNWLLFKVGPTGMTIFEYLLGAVCYKMKLFTRLYDIWKKIPAFVRVVVSAILVIGMLFGRTLVVPSLFVAPVTAMIIITLFHFWKKPCWIENAFLFIGKHSTNIWLTHMFFYAVLFKNFVYAAKIPILIFVFMMAVTVIVSMAIKRIEKLLKEYLWNTRKVF